MAISLLGLATPTRTPDGAEPGEATRRAISVSIDASVSLCRRALGVLRIARNSRRRLLVSAQSKVRHLSQPLRQRRIVRARRSLRRRLRALGFVSRALGLIHPWLDRHLGLCTAFFAFGALAALGAALATFGRLRQSVDLRVVSLRARALQNRVGAQHTETIARPLRQHNVSPRPPDRSTAPQPTLQFAAQGDLPETAAAGIAAASQVRV